MAGRTFYRYFPSFLIGVVILIAAFLAEQQHDRVVRQEKLESVGIAVQHSHTKLEETLEEATHNLYRLGMTLGSVEPLTQSVFDTRFEEVLGNHPEIVLAEFAPDFVVRFVHPLTGNEDRIGTALPTLPGETSPIPGPRSLLAPRFTGPKVDADGTSLLVLRVPVITFSERSVHFDGALTVHIDVTRLLETSGISDPDSGISYTVTVEDSTLGTQSIVHGGQEATADTSISAEVLLPHGKWIIQARPTEGWNPVWEDKLAYRSWLLLLGLLIFIPAVTANHFSFARRKTILDLEAAEARLSGVLQNMPGAVFAYTMPPGATRPGPEDDIVFFNRAAAVEIFGDEDGKETPDLERLWEFGPEDEVFERFLVEIAQSVETLRPWHFQWSVKGANATTRWLEGRGHPTRLPDGSTRCFCLIVDATKEAEKTAELERQQQLALLAQKNDSIGKLTGGVAHDFNNLLAVVMGNLELLREELENGGPVAPDMLEYVDNSLAATERGADLTRKMLAFARRARLEPADVNLNEILGETSAWAGRTMPESIRLETSFGAGLPLARVDRSSLESALLNLMVNARDAMPEGGTLFIGTSVVELSVDDSVCVEQGLAPGPYVKLTVQDSGKGISEHILPRIFEPFFTTKPPTAGSGLGLSMVQGFMQQSGGAVRVTTEPGKGTRFELYFKALDRPATSVTAAPTLPDAPVVKSKARILLAEDEPDVRKVLASTLSRAGYGLVEAESGDAAFTAFKQNPDVDLLLTDIVMPGTLQGTDLANAIRCMSPGLPVVFLSGYDANSAEHGAPLDPRDIRLSKPVSRVDLIAAVERSLGRLDDPADDRC